MLPQTIKLQSGKVSTNKPAKHFIAPGTLANSLGKGFKSINLVGAFRKKSSTSNSLHDTKIIGENIVSNANEANNAGPFKHKLVLHFGDVEDIDSTLPDEFSYLDLLGICKRHIDIYSIGVRITYGKGKRLGGDGDIVSMFAKYKGVKEIHIFVKEDESMKPISFRVPSFQGDKSTNNNGSKGVETVQQNDITSTPVENTSASST
ncbi:hypothetical protein SLA2020_010370 [Shorea laevis]